MGCRQPGVLPIRWHNMFFRVPGLNLEKVQGLTPKTQLSWTPDWGYGWGAMGDGQVVPVGLEGEARLSFAGKACAVISPSMDVFRGPLRGKFPLASGKD